MYCALQKKSVSAAANSMTTLVEWLLVRPMLRAMTYFRYLAQSNTHTTSQGQGVTYVVLKLCPVNGLFGIRRLSGCQQDTCLATTGCHADTWHISIQMGSKHSKIQKMLQSSSRTHSCGPYSTKSLVYRP